MECEESATGCEITKEWLDAAHEWYCSQVSNISDMWRCRTAHPFLQHHSAVACLRSSQVTVRPSRHQTISACSVEAAFWMRAGVLLHC